MRVSIVIPLYNVAKYIEDCLISVANQTFNGELECVIIDDCSSDSSISVAQSFIDGYCGKVDFITVHHDSNRGAAAARNTGIDIATGDYIMFVDGDDWILKDCVQLLVDCLIYSHDSDLVQCGIKTTNGSIPLFDFEQNPLPEFCNDRYEIKTSLLGRGIIPNSPCGKLLPLSFMKENHLYFHEGIVMEDELWVNLLAKHVMSVSVVNKNLYIYRIREGSVVTSGKGVDPYRKLILYDLMIDTIDEPYIDEQVDYLIILLDKIYFGKEDLTLRKKVGTLLRKISKFTMGRKKCLLFVRYVLSQMDSGNKSIAYYLFYRLSLLKIHK